MKRPLLLLLIMLLATPAQAIDICQCRERALREDINGAFAIFSGTVTGIKREFNPDKTRVEFDVHASWLRVKTQDYAVFTQGTDMVALAREGVTCGMKFDRGATYLVYAWRSTSERGYPWVSQCSHTKLLTEAASDIAQLGEPLAVFDTPREPNVPRDFTPTPLLEGTPLPMVDTRPLPGTEPPAAVVEPAIPPTENAPVEENKVFEWNTNPEAPSSTTVPLEVLEGIVQPQEETPPHAVE